MRFHSIALLVHAAIVTGITAAGGLVAAQTASGKPPAQTAKPKPAPALSPQVEREWGKISSSASQLALDGKTREAIASVDKFLARNPNVADAHFLIATFYEQLAGFESPPTPEQRRHLETAVRHVLRSIELVTDPQIRFVMTWKLVRLHSVDELNRPADAERYARQLVDQYPARAESHVILAQILRAKDDTSGAADVLRKGRTVSTMSVPGLLSLIQYLIEHVQASRELPRDVAGRLLDESIAVADAVLKHPENDDQSYRLATMSKAMSIGLLAERVEEDRAKRIALLVESERWGAPIDEHKNRMPPPARSLSAQAAADLEWDYLQRWNGKLAEEGRLNEAVTSYERYLAGRPKFYPVHSALAELFARAAETATDKTRVSHLERAAAQLALVADLAPPADRENAFSQLLDLYGPTQLNRPGEYESAARGFVKRNPTVARGHYALAALLLDTSRAKEAEGAFRGARTAIRATASSRADMTNQLLDLVRRGNLPAATNQRLFDEATSVLAEATKIDARDVLVLEARARWLIVAADRFEKDTTKANAQREEARQLLDKVFEAQRKSNPAFANLPPPPPIPPPPPQSAPSAPATSKPSIPPPKIVKHVTPTYPDLALKARIQGQVVVQAVIGVDGKVRTAKVVRSIQLLDDAALEAVRQYEYEPSLLNGVAVEVIVSVTVTFSLK